MTCLDAAWPFAWAAPGDRVGLQVGSPQQEVARLLVALEASEAVVAEARELGADLLLTHHPLLYAPVTEIREDRPAGRLLAQILRAGLAVVACHTNLDVAPGGLNDYLAARLGLTQAAPLSLQGRDPWLKLVVFVPLGYEDRIRAALFDDRVGVIGRYSHCSFAARGQGTYLPEEGARPWRGQVARLERAEEVRLEVILPQSRAAAAVARMIAAHPYEEVAYDLYPLDNPAPPLGYGRVGDLAAPCPWAGFRDRLPEIFPVRGVRLWGEPPPEVTRVAVCGGSGGELIAAARDQGAQVFITGEVRHHQAVPGDYRHFVVLEVGHFASEVVFMPAWADDLQRRLTAQGAAVEVLVSRREEPPCVVSLW
ncbi:MAG: Nif3-like dinuclear metal center hexameric protein [Syntrophobacterales bacterium]|nr:Nif3-like dinuclear metal center hexameric protein [Syntrophobacterales bacterium]